jgi:hypothetical protein
MDWQTYSVRTLPWTPLQPQAQKCSPEKFLSIRNVMAICHFRGNKIEAMSFNKTLSSASTAFTIGYLWLIEALGLVGPALLR